MSPQQLDETALDWIKLRSLTLAKLINTTTLKGVWEVLTPGYEAGESIQQLTKRIEEYFKGTEKWRAEITARTEVIAASNEGALHRYELEGINKSEFMAAPDACEECLPLDGKEFITKEGHGVIPVHVNCRCVFLPVV